MKLLIALLFLSSCRVNNEGNEIIYTPEILCIKGWKYYRYGHGMSPLINEEGKFQKCSMIEED